MRYVPIQIESSTWHKKAVVANNLILTLKCCMEQETPANPLKSLIKISRYGQGEFDLTLDMGKAVAHRFAEGKQAWNYDGRSGFATKFSLFTGN